MTLTELGEARPPSRTEWIRQEWRSGRTLGDIGAELGISRERVGQIIGRAKTNDRGLLSLRAAGRQVDVSASILKGWIRRGWLQMKGALIDPAALSRAAGVAFRPRQCIVCGAAFVSPTVSRTKCESCIAKRLHNPYRAWSAERRAKHLVLMQRWDKAHPEAHKTYARRSALVWRLTHRDGIARGEARLIAHERYPDPAQ